MKSIEPFRLLQDAAIYVLCVTPIAVLRVFVEPFHRGFYCDDESIRYPNRASTIGTVTMILVGVIVPMALILFVETYRMYKVEPRFSEYQQIFDGSTVTVDIPIPLVRGSYIGDRLIHPLIIRIFTYAGAFLFGASACEVLTDIAKITIGELRPHFLEACQPDWTRINCSYHRYVTDYVCLGTDSGLIREARQSFPSGHASFSAFCACFAVLYLRSRASWPLAPSTGRLVRPLIQYALIMAAFGTGLTRIADNQHHGVDVAFGFILGIATAWATCYHFGILDSESKNSWERENWKNGVAARKSAGLGEAGDKETVGLLFRD